MRCSFLSARLRRGLRAGLFCAASIALFALLEAPKIALGQPHGTDIRDQAPGLVAKKHGVEVTYARTESPYHTLASFRQLRGELEATLGDRGLSLDRSQSERLSVIAEELTSLVDLSQVPSASRRQVGTETVGHLLDIFGRIELPDLSDVPDLSAFDAEGPASYSIPDTPFRIVRVETGPREGEFLFSGRTISAAPRFYRSIKNLPLRTSLPIGSWSTGIRQITGPLVPAGFVAHLPESWKAAVLDTPVWKIALAGLLAAAAAVFLVVWHRAINTITRQNNKAYLWLRILNPVAIIVVVLLLQDFVTYQVNVAGHFARLGDGIATVLIYLAGTWAFWIFAVTVFEWIVLSPRFPEGSLDSSLLRLVARITGAAGAVIILSIGAQEMGLPVLSLLAGLGIGGLAVALAIRPTLENLISGFILFLDKPIRVGDFCTFGNQSGTVQSIGVRSTQIRALDRTMITIPNAQFADMQIINWARCDQMLIDEVIGLRYETNADQLRYVLARIREMFHSHPRVNSDTVRVRFTRYGGSSLELAIRVYAMTREWNDYYAIKEDVLFRIKNIVEQAGAGFAFPSQTLYMRQDEGPDRDLGEKAIQRVAEWRRTGQLPFPRFSADKLQRLEGQLSYPPPGSPDFYATKTELPEGEERLSAEPLQAETPVPAGEERSPEKTERM